MTAMVWSIALFGVMSLVCALAWDYNSLLVFRIIQGIGLGGEVPVAAVFISELAKAQGRGRFVLLYELVFPIGLVAASLAGLWIVPPSRLAIDVRHRRAAGVARVGVAAPAAGIAALACRARARRGGASRHGADRDGNPESNRSTAAAPQPVVSTLSKPASLGGPVRTDLLASHAGGLGDLVLVIFRELRPLDLAADRLSHRVQAAARRFTAVRIDHASGRPCRDADLRPGHRPCRPPPLVCVGVRGCGGRLGRARALPRPDRRAGAGLHDHRLLLRQHHQYRRLSLHAGTLPDPRARAWRRHRHRLAAVCLHDRADRGRT